jgi:hypothetical protein
MAKGFEHVAPGDPISAAQFNSILDAARASNEARAKLSANTGENALFQQRTIIQVKNNSGAARMRFDVLGIDGPLFEFGSNTFKEFPRLKGVTPQAGAHEGKFVILLESGSESSILRAVASGVAVVQIDMKDGGHKWADITDADCEGLTSCTGPSGAEILAVDSGTGAKWAVVRLGPVASPVSPIVSVGGASTLFSLFGTSGTEYTNSGGTVELDYAAFGAEGSWSAAFADTARLGFPSLTDHPVFEWQEADDYDVHSVKVKQSGLYRLTLEYSIEATFISSDGYNAQTSTADSHYHEYSASPGNLGRIAGLIALGAPWDAAYTPGVLQFPPYNGGTAMTMLAGTLVGYHAYVADAGIPVYLSWNTILADSGDKINIGFLRLTAERVGDYVSA